MKKLIIAIFILLPFFANAETPPLKVKEVGAYDKNLASQVEKYLNSLKTISADFGQAGTNGAVSSGKFYLQRPGKFRWEYLTGQQILVVSNGSQIAYYDKKLDELTYIPLDYSIAGFLAQENIKLSGEMSLVGLSEDEKEIRAIITQTKKPEEGKLALYFDKTADAKSPMLLTKMEVIDQDRNITAVVLRNQKFNTPIEKDLFVFKNPRLYKNVWDKKK